MLSPCFLIASPLVEHDEGASPSEPVLAPASRTATGTRRAVAKRRSPQGLPE